MADTAPHAEATLEGGSYEVIQKRLLEYGRTLAAGAEALNQQRLQVFGGVPLEIIASERIRTENNCIPRDIVELGGHLLFGYNVFMGLRTETKIVDVFSIHRFAPAEGGFDVSALPFETIPGLLDDPQFQKDFAELHRYYKDARLLMLRRLEGLLLAVFQVGQTLHDFKAFRWTLSTSGKVRYVDNRGDQDHVFPASHDFEWIRTTREQHVRGRHPHVNILNKVFVETVHGDLTVKVENNTEDGLGIYREPVQDPRQSLDDGEISYAEVGSLILLKVLPYREEKYRYLIYNTRQQSVTRQDAIGLSCIQLPEDHGIVFPGGFYLQSGESKAFDLDADQLRFLRAIRAPNGEDVLYVFYQPDAGQYLLLPYNLIRKSVETPLSGNGFTVAADGKMLAFKASPEPTRIHPMQIWQSPFSSEEHAAQAPKGTSFLEKIGNAELVRAISDAYSLRRLVETHKPTRGTYEALIQGCTRALDAYPWLDRNEVGQLKRPLLELKKNADLVVDEFEKVLTLQKRASEALGQAKAEQTKLLGDLRPEDWRQLPDFLTTLTQLRKQRGHLITLKDIRYMALDAVSALENEVITQVDRVSRHCAEFLLTGKALEPVVKTLDALVTQIEAADKANILAPFAADLDTQHEGLTLLSEVVATLKIDDASHRTQILESISEVFGHLNRARAILAAQKKAVLSKEGRAEFAAQWKLLGQAVSGALALADSPEKCDEQLSRLMVQLEELEGRFSEFDEFLAELTTKREEIYEALGTKRQQLLEDRQRRAQNLYSAAQRIFEGMGRRLRSFANEDELNAYFAADAMVQKLRQLTEQLRALGDTVKADDLLAKLKTARQDAFRALRDQRDLFEEGSLIKLGKHRFLVNTQAFELTLVPKDGGMSLHITGTDFFEPIQDETFAATRDYWDQQLPSETPEVYRAEYLATGILLDAEAQQDGLSLAKLHESLRENQLLELVRARATARYDEGYERGLHDADATRILEKLLTAHTSAGLLRYAPAARALGVLYWAFSADDPPRQSFQRRCLSLHRLRRTLGHTGAEKQLLADLRLALTDFVATHKLPFIATDISLAADYLFEELAEPNPRFVLSGEALSLREALYRNLDLHHARSIFEGDIVGLSSDVANVYALAEAWLSAQLAADPTLETLRPALAETAAWLATPPQLPRHESAALVSFEVTELLGQHPRIHERKLRLRLDEILARLEHFRRVRVPGYMAFRAARHQLLEREKIRLRLEEYRARVLSAFVRNRLISEVYLHLIGDNLAKQLGAAGDKKRTDLMGLLLLISPPGYGKTTLMEYVASTLGMVFMKVNGPALGHEVRSLDPAEAPNATARQEVEKINLALEMGNNVMLYLDDIQHTNPELLQKFISLCDAQRRIEGVWKGRTQTYDLRGKKFAVVMAGNPYTESGEKFQIPDMLANRADTYNLGDILEGKDDVFALSYLENSLTSNNVLAPIAARSLEDIHHFIRRAQGQEVPLTAFSQSYSQVEVEEVVAVLQRLFRVQEVLLKVNLQYIASASQDDRFRTEPPFKLQGSYRNMNKLAEKVVAAMTMEELEALIRDHYVGEAQTLTTGAEQNLLKLYALLGNQSEAEKNRWEAIKKEFQRLSIGGHEQDPVSRVTATLGHLGQYLEGIQNQLEAAVTQQNQDWPDKVAQQLALLEVALKTLAHPELAVTVENKTPQSLERLLAEHAQTLESTLLPLVRATTQSQDEMRQMLRPLQELVELMRLNALNARAEVPRS